MGGIKQEVELDHLSQFKNERAIIEPLCSGFEISWARERRAYNTSLSVYILTPDKFIRETFGFNTQLAFFIPHFKTLQPRVFQAIDHVMHEEPLKGRVDRQTFFLLCETEQDKKILSDYVTEHSKAWIAIGLTPAELESSRKAKWGIRNPIATQIFTRDLFDQQLPLISDVDFFGREALLFDFKDAISKSQNRGIFGLRKTGKTSLIFKLMRNIREDPDTIILYYDCKKPIVRQKTYQGLLEDICNDISAALRLNQNFAGVAPPKRIELIADHVGRRKRVCIVFDEIEYVSFLSKMDTHWHQDYINLWQTLWSLQSEYRNFCFIVSGVNPTVVERDNIEGVQNPLFGIVPHQYLTGLNLDELRRMLNFLGRRMGLYFDESALRALHGKYGGHPLLTRKACSSIHSTILFSDRERPFDIDSKFIASEAEVLDDNMEFYFKHILSELEAFYPEEYDMLGMTVSGQLLDFAELARDVSLRRHLENYGLVAINPKTYLPTFLIDCLRSYLKRETARTEKRPYSVRVNEGEVRDRWLSARLIQITKEIRALDATVENKLRFRIFPNGGLGEPEEFVRMPSSANGAMFERAINLCYKSIVEEIDRSGKAQRRPDFFFTDVRSSLPRLFDATYRIRVYRHWRFHSELNRHVSDAVRDYFLRDLGEEPSTPGPNEFLVLQQIILDELLLAIQEELAALTD